MKRKVVRRNTKPARLRVLVDSLDKYLTASFLPALHLIVALAKKNRGGLPDPAMSSIVSNGRDAVDRVLTKIIDILDEYPEPGKGRGK